MIFPGPCLTSAGVGLGKVVAVGVISMGVAEGMGLLLGSALGRGASVAAGGGTTGLIGSATRTGGSTAAEHAFNSIKIRAMKIARFIFSTNKGQQGCAQMNESRWFAAYPNVPLK